MRIEEGNDMVDLVVENANVVHEHCVVPGGIAVDKGIIVAWGKDEMT